MQATDYKKLLQSFRYWVKGKAENDPEYYKVLEAIRIASDYHKGKRKDDSPEFGHQIAICSYLRTIHKLLIDPVKVFIVALLHDTIEDYEESRKLILETFPDEYDMVNRISKIEGGKKLPYDVYFGRMQECHVCSIVKLVDRMANIHTMIGVFDYDKQTQYLKDLDDWFLPMLKYSKRKFPQQEAAYENLKSALFIQKHTIMKMRECYNINKDSK